VAVGRIRSMESVRTHKSASVLFRGAGHVFLGISAIVFFSLMLSVAGCERMMPLDTKPLDVAAKARAAGLPDDTCIEIVRIYHVRDRPFDAGDTVAGLVQAHLRADTILDLASLDQLGVNAGELRLIRLAGLSDSIVLEVARHEAAGKPVLSGAALSNMRNAGMRESILLELVRRGVPDSEGPTIIRLHRHGASEADILRRYPAA